MGDIGSTIYHTLFQNLPEGVIVETNDRRVAAVNREFCEIFGLAAAAGDLVGADGSAAADRCKSLLADPGTFLGRIAEIVAARRPVHAEPIRFADGRVYERTYVPIEDPEAGFVGHLWQYRLVTRLRRERAGVGSQAQAPRGATAGSEIAMTSDEALQYLKVSKRTLYRLIDREGLPTLRVGRQFRFRRSEIDTWLQTRGGQPIS